MGTLRGATLAVMTLGFAVILAACGSTGAGGSAASFNGPATISGGLGTGANSAPNSNQALSTSGQNAVSNQVLGAQNRQVIQDATLGLHIKSGSFWDIYNQAVAVAGRYNGYLVSSSAGSGGDAQVESGSVVVAVPADSYADALAALRQLGTPSQLQVSTQDVSEQYVDLNARLRNAQAQQAILLDLMKRSQSISDSITVENQLAQVTQQIEEIEGQIHYLDQKTTYSTITLNLFVQAPAPQKPSLWQTSGLAPAWSTAGQTFAAVIGAMLVAAGFLAPFLLLGLLGFGIWRLLPASIRPTVRRPAVAPANARNP
jgi:hypothetical protein